MADEVGVREGTGGFLVIGMITVLGTEVGRRSSGRCVLPSDERRVSMAIAASMRATMMGAIQTKACSR
jgi:hypothetical protein